MLKKYITFSRVESNLRIIGFLLFDKIWGMKQIGTQFVNGFDIFPILIIADTQRLQCDKLNVFSCWKYN